MTEERYLVTGATGCIGSWVVRNLIQEGTHCSALDVGDSRHRLELIISEGDISQVNFLPGDVTDLESVKRAVEDSGATQIIHLAALQLPFCRENPSLGARVNVEGTINIFEAAKFAGLKRIVYSSSAAVYGPAEFYKESPVPHDADLLPVSHYGAYKQANEENAKVYWRDDGLTSIGLRPYVVYGPGRDQGMTSTPTKAMMAVAANRDYHISFDGTYQLQYADDAAKMFIQSCRISIDGAEVYNLGGKPVTSQDVIDVIEALEPSSRGRITYEEISLPFPDEFDNSTLSSLLGHIPEISLEQGTERTIATFKTALKEGRITPEFLEQQLSS